MTPTGNRRASPPGFWVGQGRKNLGEGSGVPSEGGQVKNPYLVDALKIWIGDTIETWVADPVQPDTLKIIIQYHPEGKVYSLRLETDDGAKKEVE